MLAIPSQNHLLDAADELARAGIRHTLFFEPDFNFGYTAACTEPLADDLRRRLRRFKLWQAPREPP